MSKSRRHKPWCELDYRHKGECGLQPLVRSGETVYSKEAVQRMGKPLLEKMNSNEIRVTSSTGGEKGSKPERHDLVPTEALAEVARVYGLGAKKYAAHNWRKGYDWSLSYAAAQRHMQAFWSGEDFDPELGTRHLGNAIFHLMGLLVFSIYERYAKFDDRYKPEEGSDDHTERLFS